MKENQSMPFDGNEHLDNSTEKRKMVVKIEQVDKTHQLFQDSD